MYQHQGDPSEAEELQARGSDVANLDTRQAGSGRGYAKRAAGSLGTPVGANRHSIRRPRTVWIIRDAVCVCVCVIRESAAHDITHDADEYGPWSQIMSVVVHAQSVQQHNKSTIVEVSYSPGRGPFCPP